MTESPHKTKIAIVTPIFDDWVAFERLLADLDALPGLVHYGIKVFAIDDGSPRPPDTANVMRNWSILDEVQIVRLACNLGHQRAIAVGLVMAVRADEFDAVVVMDCDGEDRPQDVVGLLRAWERDRNQIVFSGRARRSESVSFRAFYRIYKVIFRAVTGQQISFGNFCILPAASVHALVRNSAIWNNLAAAITRSRIPATVRPTERGHRYAGESKLNFVGLTLHGLGAMSVYSDVAMVRIILFACVLAGLVLLGIIAVVGLRLLTELAIPGWASSVGGILAVILIQALLIVGVALFQLLSSRSANVFIPLRDVDIYVAELRRGCDASAPPTERIRA